jgi:hypothetical protein
VEAAASFERFAETRFRRSAQPTPKTPTSIKAQLPGSGTAETVGSVGVVGVIGVVGVPGVPGVEGTMPLGRLSRGGAKPAIRSSRGTEIAGGVTSGTLVGKLERAGSAA